MQELAVSENTDRDYRIFIDGIFAEAFRNFNRSVEKHTSVPKRKKLSKSLEEVRIAEKEVEPFRIKLGNALAKYNCAVGRFPNKYIAAAIGMKPMALCTIPEELPKLLQEHGNESA